MLPLMKYKEILFIDFHRGMGTLHWGLTVVNKLRIEISNDRRNTMYFRGKMTGKVETDFRRYN